MRLVTPALAYFGLVFGTGFALGTLRVLVLVPLVGERMAELLEMPLMLAATVFAARLINRHFLATADTPAKLRVGVIALGLMLSAELVVGMALRGLSAGDALFNRDPISGLAYYVSLLLFALMPWLVSSRHTAR